MKIIFCIIGCLIGCAIGLLVGKFVIWLVKLKLDNRYLKQEVELYKSSIQTRDYIIEEKNRVIRGMIEQANKQRYATFVTPNNPEVLEAIKYAMKHAHPDNGGNAEDFIKFKKCYEELTRQ